MPFAPPLSLAIRQSLTRQIGDRLPISLNYALVREANPTLGESLPVLVLPGNRIKGDSPLGDRLVSNGQWHHQIYHGGTATQFARSSEGGDGTQTIGEVVTSDLAAAVSQSFQMADAKMAEDAETSLLSVPTYYLTALYLHKGDQDHVIVVDRPKRLSGIEKNVPYEAEEFLTLLGRYEPASGVPFTQ